MVDYYLRTSYDGMMTVNVTVDGSGGTFKSIAILLTANQLAKLAAVLVIGAQMTPLAAINYQSSTPGTTATVPATLDPDGNPVPILIAQKPNEIISILHAHQNIWMRAQGAGTTTVQITLFYVQPVGT